MSRALGPRVGMGADMAAPLAVIALLGVPVALAAWAWTAGRAASWLTGHGCTGPEFDRRVRRRLPHRRPGGVLAGRAEPLVWKLFAAGLVAAVAAVVPVWRRRPPDRAADPLRSLATAPAVGFLTPAGPRPRRGSCAPTRRRTVNGAASILSYGDIPRGPREPP